jgi:hypothetical protein
MHIPVFRNAEMRKGVNSICFVCVQVSVSHYFCRDIFTFCSMFVEEMTRRLNLTFCFGNNKLYLPFIYVHDSRQIIK